VGRDNSRASRAADGGRPLLGAKIDYSGDRILKEGLAFHEAQPALAPTKGRKRRGRQRRRTGHNLLLRLTTRKENVLRFLADPDVGGI
jgi:transposase